MITKSCKVHVSRINSSIDVEGETMSKLKFFAVAAIFALCAATAMATNFRAADQVYVPAVIHPPADRARS